MTDQGMQDQHADVAAGARPVVHDMVDFAADLAWPSLPDTVRREAVRAWVNWVTCAVGGARTPSMEAAVRGTLLMESAGDVPLLARPERVSASNAALLGCLSSSALTYDDTHLATITHPTGPVASSLLAVASRRAAAGQPVAGDRLLAALVVGLELECRVSCAIVAGGSGIGWYMTGLSGGIGAAAAVGRLLGLDRDQMISAVGLAAAQAGGFRATHGSMAITYVPGLAARGGVAAAYMAAGGFDCGAIAVDGRNGLLEVLTGRAETAPIRAELGRRYEFLDNAYKPYPCGIVIHPTIDACLHLSREDAVRPAEIASVSMRVHPDALRLTWRRLPETELDAQVSLFHWAAAALVAGCAGVEQGRIACVRNADVRALQARMEAVADPGLANNQAEVSVRLRDGHLVEHLTENAVGSASNPMSDEQLTAKFLGLTGALLGDVRSGEVLRACWEVEHARDVASVIGLTH